MIPCTFLILKYGILLSNFNIFVKEFLPNINLAAARIFFVISHKQLFDKNKWLHSGKMNLLIIKNYETHVSHII